MKTTARPPTLWALVAALVLGLVAPTTAGADIGEAS